MIVRPTSTRIFTLILLFCLNTAVAQTSAIRELQSGLPLTKDSVAYVNKLNRIAILMQMKSPDSCFYYAAKAKSISIRNNYRKGETDAESVLGIVMTLKGLNHDALKKFTKVLESYKEMGDLPGMALTYGNMSSTHRYLSDSINSVKALRRMIAVGRRIPNDSVMGLINYRYCDLAPGLSVDSSRYYIAESKRVAKIFKDSRVLLVSELLEASVLLNIPEKKVEALPILNKGLKDAEAAGLEYLQLTIYDLYAKYYAADPRKALGFYDEALKIIDKNGYINLKSLVLQRMIPYAEHLGDKEEQFRIAKLLAKAVSEKQYRLSAFFSDYIKYNNLEDSNRILEITSAAERKRVWILSLFSAACIALLFIIFRLYRKTRRESKQLKELNREIEQKNIALQSSDVFKNKLVSILAHDFRSPLASTVSLLEILKMDDGIGPEELESFYERIQTDITNILNRFDSTLQWIRQQLIGYSLSVSDQSPKILFDEVSAIFSTELVQKNLHVKNNIDTDLLVATDKEMLQFINRNLLSNAIKFSPQDGTITLSSQVKGGKFRIVISDEGKGLDDKTLENLFSISAKGTTKNGAGIALSMCRDFIDKLSGTIGAENGNNGAVFYYELDLRQ